MADENTPPLDPSTPQSPSPPSSDGSQTGSEETITIHYTPLSPLPAPREDDLPAIPRLTELRSSDHREPTPPLQPAESGHAPPASPRPINLPSAVSSTRRSSGEDSPPGIMSSKASPEPKARISFSASCRGEAGPKQQEQLKHHLAGKRPSESIYSPRETAASQQPGHLNDTSGGEPSGTGKSQVGQPLPDVRRSVSDWQLVTKGLIPAAVALPHRPREAGSTAVCNATASTAPLDHDLSQSLMSGHADVVRRPRQEECTSTSNIPAANPQAQHSIVDDLIDTPKPRQRPRSRSAATAPGGSLKIPPQRTRSKSEASAKGSRMRKKRSSDEMDGASGQTGGRSRDQNKRPKP